MADEKNLTTQRSWPAGLNTPVLEDGPSPFLNTPPAVVTGHNFGYWPKLNDLVQNMAKQETVEANKTTGWAAISWLKERVARLEDENAKLRGYSDQLAAGLAGMRHRLAAEANDPDSLEKQVDNVLRGIQQNKVIPRQVDDLHSATVKSKQDRAVGRAIKTV
jgi:TRAP-type mannitol/chloroaromatic compound transport system substrate-binding protein